MFVLGGLSGGGVCDAESLYLWVLVNSGNYFVCGVYGEGSQDAGYGFSGFCYDSTDSGSGIVSYHELDDDEGLGELSEGWNLYDSFCSEHGCGNDVDDHCFSNGVAVDVQTEADVNVRFAGWFIRAHTAETKTAVCFFCHRKLFRKVCHSIWKKEWHQHSNSRYMKRKCNDYHNIKEWL